MDGSNGYGEIVDMLLRNYRPGNTISTWSFGKVKVAKHVLTGDKVAIYIINRRETELMQTKDKVRKEINILRLLRHPHIREVHEVVETRTAIYVIMEYMESGELFDYLVERGRLQEDEANKFFQQIISGVEYCHKNMVVHRDLRLENLLLDSKNNVKITDFSLSKTIQHGLMLKTSCGSLNYAAPEVITGKLYDGPGVDVWSCGIILYALLCGTLPFDDENFSSLYTKIKGGKYSVPSYLSPSASDLISKMLVVDPLKRITIPEITQHPWFQVSLQHSLAVPSTDTTLPQPKKGEFWVKKIGCKDVLFCLLSKLSLLLPLKLVRSCFGCLDEELYTSTWFCSREDDKLLEFEETHIDNKGSKC